MKRIMSMFCAVVMLLALGTYPAMAQDTADAVFTLLSRDALGVDTPIGSAVLLADGQTLVTTTEAAQARGALYARGGGKVYAVTRGASMNDRLLRLTIDTVSSLTPLTLNTADVAGSVVVGVDAAGNALRSDMTALSTVLWQEASCTLISAKPGFLCGAAVLDGEGALVGIVAAVYGEGNGRYVVLAADALSEALTGEKPAASTDAPAAAVSEEETVWLSGVTLTAQGGVVTVDWSSSPVADAAEDSVYAVFYSDPENPYYSGVRPEAGEKSVRIPGVPGRTMNVWVQHAHGTAVTDVILPEDCASITLDKARPFNKFGYRDTAIGVGLLPAKQAEDPSAVAELLDTATAEDLLGKNGALCMQVSSRYRVTRASDSVLLVALFTPDDTCYTVSGGFTFDPDLVDDVWHVDLTYALKSYASFNNGVTHGTYTIRYYFDGTLVNSFEFAVK